MWRTAATPTAGGAVGVPGEAAVVLSRARRTENSSEELVLEAGFPKVRELLIVWDGFS